MTHAIERGSAGDALRELGLMMDNGAVPYMILGQLAWFVRTKVPAPKVSVCGRSGLPHGSRHQNICGRSARAAGALVVELCGGSVSAGPFGPGSPVQWIAERTYALFATRAESRLVAAGGVAVNDALAGHLVDQRNRLVQLFLRALPCPSRR